MLPTLGIFESPDVWLDWWAVISCKVTVVLLMALVMSVLLRRAAARSRYRLWSLAVLGALLLPLLSPILPTFKVACLPPEAQVAVDEDRAASPATPALPTPSCRTSGIAAGSHFRLP